MLSRVAAPLRWHINTNFVAECTSVFHVLSSSVKILPRYWAGTESNTFEMNPLFISHEKKFEGVGFAVSGDWDLFGTSLKIKGDRNKDLQGKQPYTGPHGLNCTFMRSTYARYPQIMMAGADNAHTLKEADGAWGWYTWVHMRKIPYLWLHLWLRNYWRSNSRWRDRCCRGLLLRRIWSWHRQNSGWSARRRRNSCSWRCLRYCGRW